ncbi:hypothetical protein ACIHQR_06815 [Corallococcus coralloides]|uniref:hypothetical protein n=1 Tax=Corallococcus coralloides TaxID=184914 RepID=UPI003850050E
MAHPSEVSSSPAHVPWRDAGPPAAGVVLWVGVLFAAFHPGLMSVDTLDQYEQGLRGTFNDVHPPLGSWLLGLSGRWVGSPSLVLLGQLLLLAGSMALLVRSPDGRTGRKGLFVLGAFLLVPTVWALAVTLWKDVMSAAVLLGAVAALRYRRPLWALVLLVAGTALRHNALVAALPLAVPVMAQVARPTWRWPARALVLAGLVAGLALTPSLINRALGASRAWAAGQLFVFDLAGIYAAHPELFPASSLAQDLSAAELARGYSPFHVGFLLAGAPDARPIHLESLPGRRDVLVREWARVVHAWPAAYAHHRWETFRRLIGAFDGPVFFPFQGRIDPNPWGFRLPEQGGLHRCFRGAADLVRDSLLFRGWAWLGALTVLALLSLRDVRRRPLAFFTALSGLGYGLSYLVISIGCDFRFLYWSVIATFAALALRVSGEAPAPGASGPPSPEPQRGEEPQQRQAPACLGAAALGRALDGLLVPGVSDSSGASVGAARGHAGAGTGELEVHAQRRQRDVRVLQRPPERGLMTSGRDAQPGRGRVVRRADRVEEEQPPGVLVLVAVRVVLARRGQPVVVGERPGLPVHLHRPVHPGQERHQLW